MHIATEGPQLISAMIKSYLGLDCSVLMGANIAEVCICLFNKIYSTQPCRINLHEFNANINLPAKTIEFY